jgi:hypothetical protein
MELSNRGAYVLNVMPNFVPVALLLSCATTATFAAHAKPITSPVGTTVEVDYG